VGALSVLHVFAQVLLLLVPQSHCRALLYNLGNEDSLLRIPGQIIQTGTVVAGQRLGTSLEFVVGVIVPGSGLLQLSSRRL